MLDLSYPYWYLLVCAFLSALLTALLYFFKEDSLVKVWRTALSFLRFTVLFVLCVLLLKPILKYASVSFDKPILVLGIDNSKSILLNKDSVEYKVGLQKKIEELKSSLSPDFEWKTLYIGNDVQIKGNLDFKENATNLSAFIDYVNDFYTYDNVSAAILISDGIFNKASNPNYQKLKISAPLFTVALGDSSAVSDQKIMEVRSNSIAFLGNKFPFKVDVAIDGYAGQKSRLVVTGFGKEVYSKEIEITSNSLYTEIQFHVDAKKIGIQKFKVKILPIGGEMNKVNNEKIIYVQIKDKRQKILLVYDFPHPDIAAIRRSIEEEESYEVTMVKTDDFIKLKRGKIEANYNLVLAFQIPTSTTNSSKAFELLQSCTTSQWYVTSAKTNHLALFNSDKGIQWNGQANKTNTVQGKINSNFSLFTITKDKDMENEFPPVKVPFGVLKYSAGSHVMSFQSVSGIQTEYPLWLFTSSEEGNRKSYFFGEGIWRWKMTEYELKNSNEFFDELVTKTIQYLASKKDISRFRVFSKTSYYENDALIWNAEFYNLSYELINDPQVFIKVTKENGDEYDLEMNREGDKYYLNMGKLGPGQYSYVASLNYEGKDFSKTGEFSVKKLDLEYKNLQADYNLIRTLAEKNQGNFFTYNQWDDLILKISEQKAVKRSYEEIEIKDLIHQKSLFFLLLVLIGVEWLVRKREGTI